LSVRSEFRLAELLLLLLLAAPLSLEFSYFNSARNRAEGRRRQPLTLARHSPRPAQLTSAGQRLRFSFFFLAGAGPLHVRPQKPDD